MAHLRSLKEKCGDCHRTATFELFNARGGRIGMFCTGHAKYRERRATAEEERERLAREVVDT